MVDASALLPAWLPHERLHAHADALVEAHVQERVRLCAPWLLEHEVINAFYIAARGRSGMAPRLSVESAKEAATLFGDLGITLMSVAGLAARVLELAVAHRRSSTYDMAYVALAEHLETTLITADERLINAVAPALSFVRPLWESRF